MCRPSGDQAGPSLLYVPGHGRAASFFTSLPSVRVIIRPVSLRAVAW
jgi:hypothetical protein